MFPTLSMIVLMHVCIIVSVAGMTTNTTTVPEFSSIIVFGDSLVDTGNNMYIKSLPLGNHLPYGRDFPTHKPTGRISNGKLVPDFLASILNLKDTVPPYLKPNLTNQDLLTGVCFASAGSGLDEWTGHLIKAIPMSKQIEYFKTYKGKLEEIAGEDETKKILENALVVIVTGSNDLLLSFYDFPVRRLTFTTMDEYQDFLLVKLQNSIKELYDNGCRKFGISGLAPVGCTPFQMFINFRFNGQCVEEQNTDSAKYNKKLKSLLTQMQAKFPGSRFVYADLFHTTFDLVNHPAKYGMKVTNVGCCGLIISGPLCNQLTPVCADASKYVFWDGFHFTEIAYFYITKYIEKEILPQFNFY